LFVHLPEQGDEVMGGMSPDYMGYEEKYAQEAADEILSCGGKILKWSMGWYCSNRVAYS